MNKSCKAPATGSGGACSLRDLYLELLKGVLTRKICGEKLVPYVIPSGKRGWIIARLRGWQRRLLGVPDLELGIVYDPEKRKVGLDWPSEAETMVGQLRLDNLQECVCDVIRNDIPGDLIETGVWRGGCTILMRAILKAYQITDRNVWVADSFEGLPPPNAALYPADTDDKHSTRGELAVGLEQVKKNFARYGLLDDQVKFLMGWFSDTLPTAPIERLAVLRLDGDMYESTMDGLRFLYPKLSVGGYLIVDDYGAVPGCRKAVDDYRLQQGIREKIHEIDWAGVFWKREK